MVRYIEWQATVETATYGAELVSARIATNQIDDLRWYLGLPINGKSHLFGDNASMVISASIPHLILKEQHNVFPLC
jgi:hypothetical protein